MYVQVMTFSTHGRLMRILAHCELRVFYLCLSFLLVASSGGFYFMEANFSYNSLYFPISPDLGAVVFLVNSSQ